MTFSKVFFFALAPALIAFAEPPDVFDLKVERVRPLRDQPGDLHIDAQGITFRSKDGKTNVTMKMPDLREANVADPHALRFETYEVQKWKPIERRGYTFRVSSEVQLDDLAQFLAAKILRPVVGHYGQDVQFEVPAYHRRVFSGTNGTLRIGDESIQYLSDRPADARTWLYRDIETIGRPDSFRFRVTTNRETYVVELKDALPEGAYELAWSKVYNFERSSQ
jgi:hypothetical protein